jgi:hypothetical protein
MIKRTANEPSKMTVVVFHSLNSSTPVNVIATPLHACRKGETIDGSGLSLYPFTNLPHNRAIVFKNNKRGCGRIYRYI